jgi:transposase InsO family protein
VAAAVTSLSSAAVVPISVQGTLLPCRLDTGSPNSFISRQCLAKLSPRPHERPASQRFIAVDGTPFRVKTFVSVLLTPNGWDTAVEVNLFVLDSEITVLLGEDVLQSIGCAIDYSAMTVQFIQPRRCCSVSGPELSDGQFLSQFELGVFARSERVKKLLLQYRDIFSVDSHDIGCTSLAEHNIDTGDNPAIFIPPYRRSRAERSDIEHHVQSMLENDVIEEADSPWGAPVFLTDKKDSAKRFVVDFRKLNEITRKDKFPMPHIDDALDQIAGCTLFSVLDCTAGYWQVPLTETAKPKTAFQTTSGQYQFKVMPFGLANAPSTFQRMMKRMLTGLDMPVYLDDIINATRSETEHIDRLEELFRRLRAAGLKLKPSKCSFGQRRIEYLGFVISDGTIQPNPTKVKAIREYPTPLTPSQLQRFLGMCLFYSRFVRHFAKLASPLYAVQNKTPKAFTREWDTVHQDAFEALRTALSTDSWLAQPDFATTFFIDVDASQEAVGAVLYQHPYRPIAFASHKLSATERNYSTIDREFFAVQWAVHHFRPYVYGTEFIVRTDHKPLLGLHKGQPNSGRQAKYQHSLAQYNFRLEYVPGKENVVADTLSRSFQLNPAAPVFVSAVAAEPPQTPPTDADLVQLFHSAGHFGEQRTRASLRSAGHRFPFMRKLVRRCIQDCQLCANKSYGGAGIPRDHLPSSQTHKAMEFVAIDLVGPLPRSNNYRYILTMIDHATHWLEAVPLAAIDAQTVADAFLRHWVYRHGPPRVLHSDRGTQFESAVLRELLATVGTVRSHTTTYHPEGNSVVERVHRTLKDRLRTSTKTWACALPEAVFHINRTPSSSSPSPFYCLYGTTPAIPGDWPTPPPRQPCLLPVPRYIHPRITLPANTLSPRFGPRVAVSERISPTLVRAQGRLYNLHNCRIIW